MKASWWAMLVSVLDWCTSYVHILSIVVSLSSSDFIGEVSQAWEHHKEEAKSKDLKINSRLLKSTVLY